MKKFILFIYFIIIPLYIQEKIYNHLNNESNLYFVLTTYRHGARYTLVKKDLFNNKISVPGKLTSLGKKQHLNIGKNLRNRYYNFLNLKNESSNLNKSKIYIRTTHIYRTILSTKKQLEGLLNINRIEDKYLDIIKIKGNFLKIYFLNETKIEIENMYKYFKECQLRKLNQKIKKDYKEYFNNNIIPIYSNCFNYNITRNNIYSFCDNTISSFFEYKYNNKKKNQIGKCGYKTAKIFYDFCVEFLDSLKKEEEKANYLFYIFFKYILKKMKNVIDGKSELKMMMLGGHDNTVGPLMGFLEKMNIAKSPGYPHYAFNIIFELRKYNKEFYLEIYYNDILKYNQSIIKFKNTLDKSKYSNYYNYCKVSSYKQSYEIKKTNNSFNYIKKLIYAYLIILCFFILYLIVYCFSKKRNKNNKKLPKDSVKNKQKKNFDDIFQQKNKINVEIKSVNEKIINNDNDNSSKILKKENKY